MPEPTADAEIDMSFLRTCLLEAGQMALGQRGQRSATIKADRTPVTEVDHQVEAYLIEMLNNRYPDHQILSEESGMHPRQETFTWVIDPIDGTRSFAAGLPIWGVSIGVLYRGEPAAGGLYLPVTNEIYWGTRRQAFYNDQPIAPVERIDLNDILLSLMVPSNFHLHFETTYPRLRSMGSTAAHLAYVAQGQAAGVVTRGVSLWDLAGMLPVLAATGIEVMTLTGQSFQAASGLDGQKIREPLLFAHPSVMDALRTMIVRSR